MLRDFLLAAGLKPSDLSEAVEESRAFVQGVARWARLGSQASKHVAARASAGSKLQHVALFSGATLQQVADGAERMTGGKR